jgi:tight adherence protein C
VPAGRWTGVLGLLTLVGGALLLGELRWARRRGLVERIGPYLPGGTRPLGRSAVWAAPSWRAAAAPLARHVGDRVARVFGVSEPLATRLARVHAGQSVTDVRLSQLRWAGGGLLAGGLVAGVLGLGGAVTLLFLAGGALLAFLVVEQSTVTASERWKQRLLRELPVVAEQLGMLLGAGYSLPAALNRLAERGRGASGRDLARVCERIRLGHDEVAALRDWARIADVPALGRLVEVLVLNRTIPGDLSRLISQEARSIRRDAHRSLVEAIERRGQQVWVPVTVATLVPGVIFLAVPFVEALRQFSSG